MLVTIVTSAVYTCRLVLLIWTFVVLVCQSFWGCKDRVSSVLNMAGSQ